MKRVKKSIVYVYHRMQEHYLTFRLLVWLKEHGITRKVNVWVYRPDKSDADSYQTDAMQRSKEFFSANAARVEKMLTYLSDDLSKIVFGGGSLP